MIFNIRSRAGWTRLWAMVCVLSSIFFGYQLLRKLPSQERLEIGYSYTRGETLEGLNILYRDDPNWTKKSSAERQAHLEARNERAEKNYQQDLRDLPEKRFQHFRTWIGAWVFFCIALRVTGEMIAWVIRGFRTPTSN